MIKGLVYTATGPTGKVYIGKTVQLLHRRKICHKSNAFNKNYEGYNSHFYKAIRKHGFNAFEWKVIFKDILENKLSEIEMTMIKNLDTIKNGYNSTEGGEGSAGFKHSEESRKKMSISSKGQIVSEETRKKLSEIRKGKKKSKEHIEKIRASNIGKTSGEKHYLYGKKMSKATIEKIKRNRKGKCCGSDHPGYGKQRSQETKNKISVANKGRKPSEKTILAIKRANTGRVVSDETRLKLSIANKGRKISEMSKKKMSDSRKGIKLSEKTKIKLSEINSINNKKFVVKKGEDIVGVWNSVSRCARDLNISKTSLFRHIYREYAGKIYKGYSFFIIKENYDA